MHNKINKIGKQKGRMKIQKINLNKGKQKNMGSVQLAKIAVQTFHLETN